MTRCECGHIIWPWQKRAIDSDSALIIHLACGGVS